MTRGATAPVEQQDITHVTSLLARILTELVELRKDLAWHHRDDPRITK